jgi:hypothetical protein
MKFHSILPIHLQSLVALLPLACIEARFEALVEMRQHGNSERRFHQLLAH